MFLTRFGDQFISVEALLLALLQDPRCGQRLLSDLGVEETKLRQAIEAVRHGPVTSQTAEETYEALKTYGSDLTQLAREGQLDPVIGRDEEIRRVVPW